MLTQNIKMECPICYEELLVGVNCVVTECGHHFHCSCLMKNAAINGFGCPFCRTKMADKVDVDEDHDEDEGHEDDDDEDDDYDEVNDGEDSDEEESDFTNDIRLALGGRESFVLRGLRWLFAQYETKLDEENNENNVNVDLSNILSQEALEEELEEGEIREKYDVLDEERWEEAELHEEEEWSITEIHEERTEKKVNEWIHHFKEFNMVSYDDLLKAYLYTNFENSFDYLKFQKINKRISKIVKRKAMTINEDDRIII